VNRTLERFKLTIDERHNSEAACSKLLYCSAGNYQHVTNQDLPGYQPGYQSDNHFAVRQPFRLSTLLPSKPLW